MKGEGRVWRGDCVEVMAGMEAESLHAVVTDPPYSTGEESDTWDGADARRNAKDKGSLSQRKANGVNVGWGVAKAVGGAYENEKGFDELARYSAGGKAYQEWSAKWLAEAYRLLKPGGFLLAFGHVKAIHRQVVAAEDLGFEVRDSLHWTYGNGMPHGQLAGRSMVGQRGGELNLPPEYEKWEGWHTGLKPSHEPIMVVRKPFAGSVGANCLKHGVGAYNLPAVVGEDGAWPANTLMGHTPSCSKRYCTPGCPVAALKAYGANFSFPSFFWGPEDAPPLAYCPKPTGEERAESNGHPTPKPVSLMAWLVSLVTQPGQRVLDPFGGSGTTGVAGVLEGRDVDCIELSADFALTAETRITKAMQRSPISLPLFGSRP